jgi:nucleoside-diphosphate-sugar epimerase
MEIINRPNRNNSLNLSPSPFPSALIIGHGHVGKHLRTLLLNKNWDVWIARRTNDFGEKSLSLDVSAPFSLPRDFDVVFYMVSAGAYTPEAYQKAYDIGVKNSLRALSSMSKRPRFILVSSTSVFSENNGGLVDESSPTDSVLFSKKSLLDGEKMVAESGLKYSIVRFSGIYGGGRTHLVDLVRSGEARLKRIPFISNRIHVEDCAGILHHLAVIDNPDSLYIGTDSQPTPYNEILQWLARKLGREDLKIEEEVSTSMHMSNKLCSNAKIIQSGYKFLYPDFKSGFLSDLED